MVAAPLLRVFGFGVFLLGSPICLLWGFGFGWGDFFSVGGLRMDPVRLGVLSLLGLACVFLGDWLRKRFGAAPTAPAKEPTSAS